jgi:hypothetical protein
MSRHDGAVLAMLAFAMLPLAGCSAAAACPGGHAVPDTITVTNQATGASVCNATVTASDGTVTATAQKHPNGDASCTYEVNPGQTGTYSITASAPGLHMTQPAPTVTLSYDQCGYAGSYHSVTIPMSP